MRFILSLIAILGLLWASYRLYQKSKIDDKYQGYFKLLSFCSLCLAVFAMILYLLLPLLAHISTLGIQ